MELAIGSTSTSNGSAVFYSHAAEPEVEQCLEAATQILPFDAKSIVLKKIRTPVSPQDPSPLFNNTNYLQLAQSKSMEEYIQVSSTSAANLTTTTTTTSSSASATSFSSEPVQQQQHPLFSSLSITIPEYPSPASSSSSSPSSIPSLPFKKLFLGSFKIASDQKILKELGVTHILNVTSEVNCFFEGSEDFHYLQLKLEDTVTAPLNQFFKNAWEFIDSCSENILIHCKQGASRSASIVVSYLMYRFGLTVAESLEYLKQKRKIVFPNPGFLKQLLQLEEEMVQKYLNETEAGSTTAINYRKYCIEYIRNFLPTTSYEYLEKAMISTNDNIVEVMENF